MVLEATWAAVLFDLRGLERALVVGLMLGRESSGRRLDRVAEWVAALICCWGASIWMRVGWAAICRFRVMVALVACGLRFGEVLGA